MKIFGLIRRIKKYFSRYEPCVEVLISGNNLLDNLKMHQKQYPKLSFAPVLKSNAYGHGLVQIAQILDGKNISFFVVDSLYEAMVLRNEGIKSDILVIGYTLPENIKNGKLADIAFTITSSEQLQEIAKIISSEVRIHLKIDTEMHRQGILPNQINEAINTFKTNKYLHLEGICSHLADADNVDETFTKTQIDRWKNVVSLFKSKFHSIKYFHISATAGASYSEESYGNVVRLGIGLYGLGSVISERLNLKPVMQMQSKISSIKTIPAGKYVGYNCAYKTDQTIKVATVPVGYFEGVDRRLSNCGFFKIGEHFCPIIGKVSMNITSIDVTSVPDVILNDAVLIISNLKEDRNSVENIAKLSHTVTYETLVHIPQHLRRRVI